VYRLIVKRNLRRAYERLSRGDYESVVKKFSESSVFEFAGSHQLGGERRGTDAVRELFRQMFDCFPDLRLEPKAIVVNGMPWNTVVAARFGVSATVAGEPYRNEGMQFLRLRFGRVVEDRLYEDTEKLAAALERIARERGEVATAA
jgi:ketosteroid isomerase-like protein